ncbi:hypothetical protein [Streptomyces sp. NPDC054837]
MPSPTRSETRRYAIADPETVERAALEAGVVLGGWKVPGPVVEALVTRTRGLVAEAIEEYSGDRVIVTTVLDEGRAEVHVIDSARRRETRHYSTTHPATAERSAADVGVVLKRWQVPEPVVEALVTQTRDLVAEAIEEHPEARIIVTTALDEGRAAVHVLPVTCSQDHNGLIDPATAATLHESARYWGATTPPPCLCATLALMGDDWKTLRPFLTTPGHHHP